MDPDDPGWLEHLDIITAWGEASAANGTPLHTDARLWSTHIIPTQLSTMDRSAPDTPDATH